MWILETPIDYMAAERNIGNIEVVIPADLIMGEYD